MQQFIKVFLDIVLWRRGPQDLPRSWLLVVLTLVAYEAVTLLQLAFMKVSPAQFVLFLVFDPLLLMGGIWLVMKLFGRSERFPQTISAVLGCSSLIAVLVSLPIELLAGTRPGEQPSSAVQLAGLAIVLVFVLVAGRIIKLATESNLVTGMAIALTYVVILNTLAGIVPGIGA
jgi:hypothetical protein